ncbi:BglG family transcription antiterminator [Anoxybacterium hadale]|uniref:BglG family transcription antiterminator n=1 Tax=Anoxybacterium hadale TaxID=3408580 RepID=UPI003AFFBF5E
MNKKTCELLTILIGSPGQSFKYDDLSRQLSVSTRSARNYMQDVTAFLREQELAHLVQVTSKGISFLGSNSDGSLIASRLIDRDFYLYKLSSEERICIIALKLLLTDKACTLSSLEKEFNASRVTLMKDMEQVRHLLSRYKIAVHSSTSQGYRLIATEKDRRELITRIVFHSAESFLQLGGKINIYAFFMNEVCFKDPVYQNLSEILQNAEDHFSAIISDARFEEILFTLKLAVARIKGGFLIAPDEAEEESVRRLSSFKVVEFIEARVSAAVGIIFPYNEKVWLTRKLYECHFYNLKSIEDNSCMQTHLVLINFLDQIGRALSIPLAEDVQLISQLSNHLKDMKKAYKNGVVLYNEFRDQILSEYSAYYSLVQKNCCTLEEHFGYRFSDDEIAYILLYLAVSVERYFEEDTIPRVIVVCHSGIGTANFLVEQLKANFNLRILASTASHKLSDTAKDRDFDLIISTIVLPDMTHRSIKVSPMLDDSDIIGLQRILLEIKKEKRRKRLYQRKLQEVNHIESEGRIRKLKEVFPLQNIILDAECSDWQEGIKLAASPLLAGGSIIEQYLSAIEASVIANGAYFVFCPGVALAHAGPGDGVNRFEISLVRLSTPVCFGHKINDPVHYILCFGSTTNPEDANIILKLMNFISLEGMLEELDTYRDEALLYRRIVG